MVKVDPMYDAERVIQDERLLQHPKLSECPEYIRSDFVRKVYALLSLQLLLTASVTTVFTLHAPTREWVLRERGGYMAALFAGLAFLVALGCYKNRYPLNAVLLVGFTACESYSVGAVSAIYYAQGLGVLVVWAGGMTTVIFAALTAYVWITRKDLRFLESGLFIGLLTLLGVGLLLLVIGPVPLLNGFLAVAGTLLFCGYILYDTSSLMLTLGPDDAIIGAVQLYLDIINLFLYLLELLRCLVGNSAD